MEININNYNPKLSLNIWGWARAATSTNDVIQNITQMENGTQVIQPMNAKRGKYIAGNAGVNKQNKFSQKFSMTSNLGFFDEYRENYFSFNEIMSKQFNNNLNLWGGVGFNWNDVFEINNSFSLGFQNVKNSNNSIFKSYNTNGYQITSEQIVRWPKHVILENNITYSKNNSFVAAPLRELVRWNAAINITMLKNEAAVLRLGVYDLLRQMNNIEVDIAQNMFSYSNSNVLGNYYMATFTYNLRPSGTKKKVGGQSLFLF